MAGFLSNLGKSLKHIVTLPMNLYNDCCMALDVESARKEYTRKEQARKVRVQKAQSPVEVKGIDKLRAYEQEREIREQRVYVPENKSNTEVQATLQKKLEASKVSGKKMSHFELVFLGKVPPRDISERIIYNTLYAHKRADLTQKDKDILELRRRKFKAFADSTILVRANADEPSFVYPLNGNRENCRWYWVLLNLETEGKALLFLPNGGLLIVYEATQCTENGVHGWKTSDNPINIFSLDKKGQPTFYRHLCSINERGQSTGRITRYQYTYEELLSLYYDKLEFGAHPVDKFPRICEQKTGLWHVPSELEVWVNNPDVVILKDRDVDYYNYVDNWQSGEVVVISYTLKFGLYDTKAQKGEPDWRRIVVV